MPGIIPTEYQNPNMKSKYTNADLMSARPSMAGLYNAADQAKQEEDNYHFLNDAYGSADPKDALVHQAQETLDKPVPSSWLDMKRELAHQADAPMAAAQKNAEDEAASPYINPIANATQEVTGWTSAIPGPIGVGSRAAFALAGLAKAADPMSHAGTASRLGDVAGGAVPELLGESYRALKGADAVREGAVLPQFGPGRSGFDAAKTIGDFNAGIPDRMLSRAREQAANAPVAKGFADLTSELNNLAEPNAPPAPSRPSSNAYSDPRMDALVKSILGENRSLSTGEEKGVNDLGNVLDSIHGNDWKPKGNGLYKEPSVGPMVSPLRQAALDALDAQDETAKRSVLFGGATSQQEGTYGEYVRPKHRYPIGSSSPRVTPRDKNVTWNP